MGLSSKQVSEVGDLDIPVVAVDEINNNNDDEAIRAPRRGRTSETKGTTPALKCPRCDSSNTKFCYYNNYSRLQPRHFCRACKRHWTAGGTLRSVPVGGSSRRTKSTTAPKHHNNTTAQLQQQQQPFVVPFNTGDTEAGAVFPDIFSRLFCPADYAAGTVFSAASASASSSNSSMHGLQESSANLMGGCYNDIGGWLQGDYLSIQQHPPPANFWNYSNLDDGAFMDFLGTNH